MDRSRTTARRAGIRLPRARGDGPTLAPGSAIYAVTPPRTRGWTALVGRGRVGVGDSPAHAGMDPRPGRRRSRRPRLPRARGDGPGRADARSRARSAPPRTRGWTDRPDVEELADEGSPAHAGMDPRPTPTPAPPRRLPRARGDGPGPFLGLGRGRGAPPRTRGWTQGHRARKRDLRGSPAHAGMDPPLATSTGRARRLPRARGDGPAPCWSRPLRAAAPPRTRGWTSQFSSPCTGRIGSPAHAGMDRSPASRCPRHPWLPRARGDGPLTGVLIQNEPPAPPRTRGWTAGAAGHGAPGAGSPAHAGMDPCAGSTSRWGWRLPRARGDGPAQRAEREADELAPPRTRGWTAADSLAVDVRGGSPAHAGMDRAATRPATHRPGLPRARGDGPSRGVLY